MSVTIRIEHMNPKSESALKVRVGGTDSFINPGTSASFEVAADTELQIEETELPDTHPAVPRKTDEQLVEMCESGLNCVYSANKDSILQRLIVQLQKPPSQ